MSVVPCRPATLILNISGAAEFRAMQFFEKNEVDPALGLSKILGMNKALR